MNSHTKKLNNRRKFGTVVESCSKKLRCVVSSLTIQLSGAGLLRSGENFSWNFLIPQADGAGILPKLRRENVSCLFGSFQFSVVWEMKGK